MSWQPTDVDIRVFREMQPRRDQCGAGLREQISQMLDRAGGLGTLLIDYRSRVINDDRDPAFLQAKNELAAFGLLQIIESLIEQGEAS